MSDVAASLRAFVFLDRKQSREGLPPSERALEAARVGLR